MATALDTFTQWFFGGPVSTQYHANEGAVIEQGVDVARPSGAPVDAVHAGTVVWTNGYQVVVAIANGLYESYTHVVSSLAVGQSVSAGQKIATISGQTGWPLSINGSPYYSTGPHVEFGVYSSLANAVAFQAGVNPTADLAAGYASRDSGGGGNPICGIPLFGGAVCGAGDALGNAGGAIGSTVGGATGAAGNAVGDLTGAIQSAVQQAIANAITGLWSNITAAGGSLLGWVGKTFGKWLVLIGIGLAMLVVLASLTGAGNDAKELGTVAAA